MGWLRLSLLAALVVVSLPVSLSSSLLGFMGKDDWSTVYDELTACSSFVSFCKGTNKYGEDVPHLAWRTQEECEARGGHWHQRYENGFEQMMEESEAYRHKQEMDDVPHVVVARLRPETKLNRGLRSLMPSYLGPLDTHFKCGDTRYLLLTLPPSLLPSSSSSVALPSSLPLLYKSTAIFSLPPRSKVGTHLASASKSPADPEVEITASLAPGVAESVLAKKSQWEDKLASTSGVTQSEVSAESDERLSVRRVLPSEIQPIVDALTESGDIFHVDSPYPVRILNRDSQALTQTGLSDSRTFWDKGIRGQDQIVGVADTGIDVASCFFEDPDIPVTFSDRVFENLNHRKVVQYVAFADEEDGDGHGTHVSGSAAGSTDVTTSAANVFVGMAPDARIAFFDIGLTGEEFLRVPSSIFSTLFPFAFSVGARVQSNSWGAAVNEYNTNARDVDRFMFQNPDFLILVAAGNDGETAGSLGTPATAKNCVSVGASENSQNFADSFNRGNCFNSFDSSIQCEENLAEFSSRGPRFDGAIAPDVTAPGQFVRSAGRTSGTDTCTLAFLQGTSMATPVTAGSAILVRQYFVDGFYPTGAANAADGFTPSAALVKAVLINGAQTLTGQEGNRDLDTAIPNNDQGFGRIELDRTLTFDDQSDGLAFIAVGDVSAQPELDDGDEPLSFSVTTAAAIRQPLKVTLVWTDPPASFGAATLLVNDLDLTVQCSACADTTIHFPNGGSSADRINNVEQVVISIADLEPNQEYVANVSAASIPDGPQAFAIVISGTIGDSELPPEPSPSPSPGDAGDNGGNVNDDGNEDEIAGIDAGLFVGIAAGATMFAAGVVVCCCNRMSYGTWSLCECLCPASSKATNTSQPHRSSTAQQVGARSTSLAQSQPGPALPARGGRVVDASGGAPRNRSISQGSFRDMSRRIGESSLRRIGESSRRIGESSMRRVAPPLPPRAPTRREDQWSEHVDPASGQTYFFNIWTGESAWEDPRRPPAV